VAVAAIDAVVSYVMFVTELNWLLTFDPLARIPTGTIQLNRGPQSRKDDKNGAVDRDFCERVSAVVKYLWHRRRIIREL